MNSTLVRRAIWLFGLVAALVAVNHAIATHERTLSDGRILRLELAPRDPRGFMQGDYMDLRFVMADEVRDAAKRQRMQHGSIIATIDAENVAKYARLEDGSALAPNEARIEFRIRGEDVRIVTNAYFFEEGTATRFEAARFGEFRVRENGIALLTQLLDAQKKPIPTGKVK
ncbi:MAG: hypothetical protein EAZ24_03175 [Burkholderiales bacterium]|nr:MAG: hypothetical protein EAZ21_14700 [Betaproteobacteria bacterium]TAG83170.1 MAG: hypothetical protein EAZ24_03175 [Burkholderiales bacterium]